jgi:hypothetical protein
MVLPIIRAGSRSGGHRHIVSASFFVSVIAHSEGSWWNVDADGRVSQVPEPVSCTYRSQSAVQLPDQHIV